MNEELIKRIDEANFALLNGMNHEDIPALLQDCRAALTKKYVPVALVSEEFGSDTHYIETIDKKMRIPEGTTLFMEVSND